MIDIRRCVRCREFLSKRIEESRRSAVRKEERKVKGRTQIYIVIRRVILSSMVQDHDG